jgi:hypothetical protein
MVMTTMAELTTRLRRFAPARTGLLTCAYIRFFIVSMYYRNHSASFEPCEQELSVGKQSCIAQRYNRMAINREVVLLNEEW